MGNVRKGWRVRGKLLGGHDDWSAGSASGRRQISCNASEFVN